MLLERLNHAVDEVTNSNDVFVIPKSICCLLSPGNITNQSDFSALYGQCLDVEWFPRQPHSKIAGSFSNGEYLFIIIILQLCCHRNCYHLGFVNKKLATEGIT